MKLRYKAITKDGKRFAGEIEAKDSKDAASFLRGRGLLPLFISEKKSESELISFLPFFAKTKPKDIVFFTRQLATMVNTGLTLMQSLGILKDQDQNKIMNAITREIIADIEEGRSFSQSLAKHPDIFSPTYLALIKAAETSGLLDKILLRLADNLEKQEKLRSTVKSALIYPLVVIIGMLIVMLVMSIFVLPQLSTLYQSLGISIPLPTQILLLISHFLVVSWPLIIGFMFIGIFAFKRWHKTESGALVIDGLMLKLPIFGKMFRLRILAEFSRTLGLMIGAGTLVVEALGQVADISGNIIFKNAVLNISQRVEKGIPVGEAMSTYSQFPILLTQMVKIGEQTGKLDESLLKASEYFETEVEQMVKNITQLMEPFIIIVLGVGVVLLILAIITPIYSLISNFK